MGLDIPTFMATYNELKCQGGVNSAMTVQFMPEEKQPHACIGCGACSRICPQNIAIPELFSAVNAKRNDQTVSAVSGGMPVDCIKCGKCEDICPQNLKIRELLTVVAEELN